MLVNGVSKNLFDSIEDAIEAFRRGEFIVVLDSADRENEGDLIIAAENVTTEQMAFLVRHSSGLICAPLPSTLTNTLALPQMLPPSENTDPNSTAYTISVDARSSSITTGISAHDRALTCRTLASAQATPSSFRRPGHVFPLRARDGGVLERRGHTEAAVEFARLAGKQPPVGVIAEIVEPGVDVEGTARMEAAGEMLRRDGCLAFGRRWGIKVVTIEALVEYVQLERKRVEIRR